MILVVDIFALLDDGLRSACGGMVRKREPNSRQIAVVFGSALVLMFLASCSSRLGWYENLTVGTTAIAAINPSSEEAGICQ